MAIGAAGRFVMDIADIWIADAVFKRDVTRPDQGFGRGARMIHHFPIGVECGKMHRHIGAKVFAHPIGHGVKFPVPVIFAGDHQIGQFKPHPGFLFQVFERFKNIVQMGRTKLVIEILGKALKVDIGRVHMAKELFARLIADIARRHRHGANARLPAGLRDINGIFKKNHRIVIGKGHCRTAIVLGGLRDHFRGRQRSQLVHLACFGNLVILAEFAGQVTARRTKGQDRRSGQKVVQRFLFNRINAKAR